MSKKPLINRKKLAFFILAILAILIYTLIFILFRGKVHDLAQVFGSIEAAYLHYGYILIFLGALIEGTFILGFYIPGSLVVLLGVSLSRLHITSFPLVILYGTLGFTIGYAINYFIGRYGWYNLIEGFGLNRQIKEAKTKLSEHYNTALFWGYMMSNTGSMLSTASGILKIPFKEFIIKTFLIQFFWSLVLGGLAYIFGATFIRIFVVYFGSVAFITLILLLIGKTRKTNPSRTAK